MKRFLLWAAAFVAVIGLVAAYAIETEPDWYVRVRYPLHYETIVKSHAKNYDLDPAMVAAVIYAESKFDPGTTSAAGAVGLMQLLPDTARGIAVRTGGDKFVVSDLLDPEINVRYGSWYLRHLLDRYHDVRTALAAYHAGQGNVDEWRRDGGGIRFPETRHYVEKVLDAQQVYAEVYADELGG